jgi:hypothetical protein
MEHFHLPLEKKSEINSAETDADQIYNNPSDGISIYRGMLNINVSNMVKTNTMVGVFLVLKAHYTVVTDSDNKQGITECFILL